MYTVIRCFTSASQLCTHLNKQRYCHFGVYKCMHTACRSTMHGMSWSGFVTGAVDPACMMSLLLRAWWAARPEAASTGTPLCQDDQPSTCDISGPRRPSWTFDTPNCTVSSVPVGWWRSGAANWKTPVDFFYSDMKPGVFMVPRAAGSLLKIGYGRTRGSKLDLSPQGIL